MKIIKYEPTMRERYIMGYALYVSWAKDALRHHDIRLARAWAKCARNMLKLAECARHV